MGEAMTKRLVPVLLALAVWFVPAPSRAVAPELLSYQGVLLQSNGVAIPNGVYNLRFRMFDHPTAGMAVFEQTLSAQVTSGLYNVVLSNNGPYDLSDVLGENTQLFMEVTVLASPPAVPSNVTLSPRQQLASVPYALIGTTEPPPPTPPSTFEAPASLTHTNPSNTPTNNIGFWAPVFGSQGLSLDVPSSGCLLEVHASVVVGAGPNNQVVGVQIEQSTNGGASYPTVVRPPVVVWVQQGRPNTAALSYVAENPPVGSYKFRATTREDDDQSYVVSPSVGYVTSQSTLSGKLWCP
jgi:hypothetical protein